MSDTDPIHLKHYDDRMPVCKPLNWDGPFTGTFWEDKVTCPECKENK